MKHAQLKQFMPIIGFLLILIVACVSVSYPKSWLWGVNWWSGLGGGRTASCITFVLLITAISYTLLRWAQLIDLRDNTVERSELSASVWHICVVVAVLLVPLLGWFFRAQSFVLGDGYSLIANLKLAVPVVKGRNLGGSVIPFVLFDVLPGDINSRAQLAYQFNSIGSGLLYVLAVSLAATVFWKSLFSRIAGMIVMLTSGNMLLFFGYAENYPLFHVFYLLACVLGYRYVRDQRLRDALLFSLATLASLVSHIFAVTLLPAAIGAVLPLIARWSKWKRIPGPLESTAVAALISFILALGMYLGDKFARMSFLPILANEFTADAYTLFSLRHISDFFNLLVMLLPGSLLLLWSGNNRKKPERHFLLYVTVTGLGLAFWVNPWLGMPRDWDLLSFWVIPFTLWAHSRALSDDSRVSAALLVPCIIANAAVLTPRVIANTDRAVMWNHFDQYFSHDTMRNMKFRMTQIQLMREQGIDEKARPTDADISRQFPEIELTKSALALIDKGRYDLAIQQCRTAISKNPMYYDAYNNLAMGQIEIGQFDSARRNLDIASAFDPYSSDIVNNYAVIAYKQNRFEEARKLFEKSLQYKPEDVTVRINLLQVAYSLQDSVLARKHGQWLRGRLYLPPQELIETVKIFAVLGLYDLGREFLEDALKKGMDTSSARMLIDRYPGLR